MTIRRAGAITMGRTPRREETGMGAVVGDLLPLGVGVAVSPVPIIAVILMLLAPRAGGTSAGFGLGWLAGIVVVTTVVVLVAGGAGAGTDEGGPSTVTSWVTLLLGVLLLALGVREWRQRPKPGDEAALPKWMAAIDGFTPVKATGLGFLLSALNPKNLLMCIGAGLTIGQANLDTGQSVLAVAVFTVIAASTVLLPVIAYAVAKDKMRHPLDELKAWLQVNNAAVMGVLVLVIGTVLLGKGLGGLL
jgi:threonine/homoserine/homoserine lactone efflux protein